MNNKDKVIFYLIMAVLGGFIGTILKTKDMKIEQLKKENEMLNQEVIDYRWQIEQVPYVIESWCKGE